MTPQASDQFLMQVLLLKVLGEEAPETLEILQKEGGQLRRDGCIRDVTYRFFPGMFLGRLGGRRSCRVWEAFHVLL